MQDEEINRKVSRITYGPFLFNIWQCQPSGSCDYCIESVGSMIIGEHICIRHSLEELRFRGGGIIDLVPFIFEIADIAKDLLHESHDRQSIKSSLKSDNSASRTVYLRFRCYETGMPLRLDVYDYSQNPHDEDEVVSYTLSAKSPNEPRIPQFSKLATPKYAIFEQSLPSPQDLEEWIKQQVDLTEHTWSPSTMLFSSLRALLTAYLDTWVELPSVSFHNVYPLSRLVSHSRIASHRKSGFEYHEPLRVLAKRLACPGRSISRRHVLYLKNGLPTDRAHC